MKIEHRPIDTVLPYARNPRVNDAAVATVAASIREFGWRQPIVVDGEGVVVVGHSRLLAARQLGMTEVPVHVAENLTEAQIKAYRLLDNKSHELSTWDLELLPLELTDLKLLDFDISTLGFSNDELTQLLAPPVNEGLCDPDDVPAPPDAATTQPGDLWILGEHRLVCGDSAKAADVDRLLDGAPIHLVNTDPPYNVHVSPRTGTAIAAGTCHGLPKEGQAIQEYDRKRGAAAKSKGKMRPRDRALSNDFMSDEDFDRVLAAWFGNITRALLPGRSFYIWGGFGTMFQYGDALRNNGEMHFSQAIIWVKNWPVLGRKDMMCDHEWCFYGWKKGAAHHFFGPNNVSDTWSVKKVAPNAMQHLTQKPVELAARAIQYSSQAGENVLDLFGGSGSTLIAAEQQGRRAFLMELDPLYADLIADRYQRYSGKPAILERTGASPIPMKPREENMR